MAPVPSSPRSTSDMQGPKCQFLAASRSPAAETDIHCSPPPPICRSRTASAPLSNVFDMALASKLKKRRTARKVSRPVEPENPRPQGQDPPGPTRPKRKQGARRKAVKAEAEAPDGPEPAEPEQKLFQTNTSFAKLGLAKWIVDTCGKLGMNYPTDIQAMAIPPVLSGKNIAGNARTGSGKTACYSLPILHSLSKDPYGVFALILVPVRELAFQVADNFRAMGQAINVSVGEIVGGRDFSIQSRLIADRTHVLVATPGRLADLLRGDFALARAFRKIRTFVLDEADAWSSCKALFSVGICTSVARGLTSCSVNRATYIYLGSA